MSSFGSMTPQMGNANQILSQPEALNQVGPSSPSFQPGMLPPPPNMQGAPQAPQLAQFPGSQPVPNSMPQNPQAPLGAPAQPQQGVVGMPPAQAEAQMIVKALISRLQNHSKGEAMARGEQ